MLEGITYPSEEITSAPQLEELEKRLHPPTSRAQRLSGKAIKLLRELRDQSNGNQERGEITTIELPIGYIEELIKLVRSRSNAYATPNNNNRSYAIGGHKSYDITSSHKNSENKRWEVTENYGPANYDSAPGRDNDAIEAFIQKYGSPSSIRISYEAGSGYNKTEIEIIIINKGKPRKPKWEVSKAERRSRNGEERPPLFYITTTKFMGPRFSRPGTEKELVDFNTKNNATSPDDVHTLVSEIFTRI